MIYLDEHVSSSLHRIEEGEAAFGNNHTSILALFKSYHSSVVYSNPEWTTTVKKGDAAFDDNSNHEEEGRAVEEGGGGDLGGDHQLSRIPISDFFGSSVQVFLDP